MENIRICKEITNNNKALKKYTYLYDKLINKSLRSEIIDTYTLNDVNEIIDALNLAPIYKNIQLWRGNIFKNELNIGDKFSFENLDEKNRYALKFSDYGFMSKSSDIEIGLEFSGNHCCLLLFTYDNPQHFLNISSISRYMDEKEYITFPGEEYIINNKYLTIYNNEIITFYHCKKISNVYDKGFFPKINNEISNILNKFHNNMFNIMNLLNDKKYLIMTNNNIKLVVKLSVLY